MLGCGSDPGRMPLLGCGDAEFAEVADADCNGDESSVDVGTKGGFGDKAWTPTLA